MKSRTKEEIEQKIKEIWNDVYEKPDSIEIDEVDGGFDIKLEAMYERPILNLTFVMQLADFFETKNINDDDDFGWSGCETCDYGSSYGFTLKIRPEEK